MKTSDFRGEITSNGQIAVPPEIASQVPPGKKVAVVLAWGVSKSFEPLRTKKRVRRGEEENAWCEAGRRRFESAYAPKDSVYEQLMHGPSNGDPSTR
jgi:hypothetical protein